MRTVARNVGGAKLANGSMLAADGQLTGTPSVIFEAVAVIKDTPMGPGKIRSTIGMAASPMELVLPGQTPINLIKTCRKSDAIKI